MQCSRALMPADRQVSAGDRQSALLFLARQAGTTPWLRAPHSTIRMLEHIAFVSGRHSLAAYGKLVRNAKRIAYLRERPAHPAWAHHIVHHAKSAWLMPHSIHSRKPAFAAASQAHRDDSPRADEDNIRRLADLEIAAIKRRTAHMERTIPCRRCRRTEGVAISRSAQTRGLDEGQTVWYTCSLCSFRWSEN